MDYSTTELIQVSGLTDARFKQLVHRGQLVLSGGKNPGRGNPRVHNRNDVLQASLIVHLGRVGIGPRRAGMIWLSVLGNLHRPDGLFLFGPRDDDSDLDSRFILPGQDDGMDRDDAPTVFSAMNLGLFKRRVDAKLAALRSVAA